MQNLIGKLYVHLDELEREMEALTRALDVAREISEQRAELIDKMLEER
jgi:hypothetical protein